MSLFQKLFTPKNETYPIFKRKHTVRFIQSVFSFWLLSPIHLRFRIECPRSAKVTKTYMMRKQ
jgi:hypothetical protein